MVLLVHPPVAKPCEPPAGIAKIAGYLRRHCAVPCTLLDANLAGLEHFIGMERTAADVWTGRALRNRALHLRTLRDSRIGCRFDRYRCAVHDLNRLLSVSDPACDQTLSLVNFSSRNRSPLRSADLVQAAERPEENLFYDPLRRMLDEAMHRNRPTHVGFSINYLSQALCAFSMIGIVKKRYPGVPVILGGGLVTSWMRSPRWRNPFGGLVDEMIAGPGEYRLSAILGSGAEPAAAGGYCPPDYEGLPLDAYLSPGRILPYGASSGCYWGRCLFCPEAAEGNPYIPIPPRRAVLELESLVRRFRPALIHLLDNAVSPAMMEALVREPPGAPWYGFARVTEHLAEEGFCIRLRRSGCVMLQIGLESGDQGVLDALRKGIDLALAKRAIGCLKKAGIETYVYLLFGTPPETSEGARRTLEMTLEMKEFIGYLNVAVFNMPAHGPDTAAFEVLPFYEGDLSLYVDFVHPAGWDRKSVRAFLEREFRRNPSIAAILRRDPPFFTSNHAAFFTSRVAGRRVRGSIRTPEV